MFFLLDQINIVSLFVIFGAKCHVLLWRDWLLEQEVQGKRGKGVSIRWMRLLYALVFLGCNSWPRCLDQLADQATGKSPAVTDGQSKSDMSKKQTCLDTREQM